MTISLFLACLAIAVYGLISLHFLQLAQQKTLETPHWLNILYGIGFGAHLLSLPNLFITPNGLNFGLMASLSLSSLAILITLIAYTHIARRKKPPILTGLLFFPLTGLQIALSWITNDHFPIKTQLSLALSFHILISMTAYAILALAFMQAILLSIQLKTLKNHTHAFSNSLSFVNRLLPPLEATENVLFKLLKIGVTTLALSIITGFLFFDDLNHLTAHKLLHKTFFSMLAWIIFSIVLIGKYRQGWQSTTALKWVQGGFVLLVLGYLGSKMVIQFIL